MNVLINGRESQVQSGESVAQLLQALRVDTDGLAVAVNGSVVVKSLWATQRLRAGDEVELLNATAGG